MRSFTSILIIAALGVTPLVNAAPPSDLPHVVVQFGDLDLTKSEGAVALYHRLQAAAEAVCGPREDRNIAKSVAFNKCVQGALSSAVVRLDQETLTAYYRAHAEHRNSGVQLASK